MTISVVLQVLLNVFVIGSRRVEAITNKYVETIKKSNFKPNSFVNKFEVKIYV
jgi:hypothetical protein